MRAVAGGSGCSSNPEGDSIGCFSSVMAALRLPQHLKLAALGVLAPATCHCSLPLYESTPPSFDVFPIPGARPLGQRDDPQCTCCLSRDSSPSRNRGVLSLRGGAPRGDCPAQCLGGR